MRCAPSRAPRRCRWSPCCKAPRRTSLAGRGVMSRVLLAIGCALPLAAATPVQPPVSVTDVMRRAGAYVDGYGAKASIVVATEHYTQQATGSGAGVPAMRRIVADFAIVNVGA